MTSNSEEMVPRNLSGHVRILGICWLVYGILRLVTALWLLSFTNTATVMFGALLTRAPDPFALMADFHFIYSFMIVLSVACGVCGILAGLGLLSGQRFGRALALVAAFLSISSIPLGITLGVYTLVVLLPWGAVRTSSALDPQSTPFKSHPITT